MNVLITLCGRGGSKGIPGKNIKELLGKPLIAYSIKHAFDFSDALQGTTDIFLSTDDQAIKDIAKKYGLESQYDRPEHLANDTAGKIQVLKDALLFQENSIGKKYDFLIDLDLTSPLRTITDLKKGFDLLLMDGNALNLFSVSKPRKNPYFNVVEQKKDGYFSLVKPGKYKSRQTAPLVYDMNASFYIYRRAFFELDRTSAITDRSLVYFMDHICFDLDEPLDFEIIEYLLGNNKLDFSL